MNRVPIGSFASVKSGFAFKSRDWEDTGIPVVKIKNVKAGYVDLEGCSYISEETAATASEFRLRYDDILISMTGHIGEVARVRSYQPMMLNQRVGRFTIHDLNRVEPLYLFYCLQEEEIKQLMVAHAYGAAQPNISPTLIQKQEVPLPVIESQRKIASILSAYDDLIENNTRRIAILEEMAQAIYREWFVNFRFPGHENVKLVDSPLGQIPEGWEATRFGDVATFENGDRGKNYPKSSEFVDEGVPFINAGHLVDGIVNVRAVNRIDDATFSRLSRGKIKAGDLLMCVRGSLGRIARVGTLNEGAIASSLVIIRDSDAVGKAYLYYTLTGQSGQQMVAELDNGVAQPNISVQSVKRYPILVPIAFVRDTFEELIHPIWEEGRLLHAKCENLRTTRDLLLPKLISGKLDVEDLDIDTCTLVDT